jgi:hypothetical protein
MKNNLKQSVVEVCIFYKDDIVVCIHVDDMFIIGMNNEVIQSLIKELSKTYTLKWETAKWILGFCIKQEKEMSTLDQHVYISKILDQYGMADSKPVRTPSIQYDYNGEYDLDLKYPYRDVIGSLLYLARGSRPDIMHSVAVASQHVQNPTVQDVVRVKRILRYLNGTRDYVLRFTNGECLIDAYCDSDWGNSKDRKSMTGILIYLCGNPIMWYSKKQSCVATSAAESEYIALAKCFQEIKWLKQLLNELNFSVKTNIYEDNQVCIAMIKNQSTSARTKHIDVKLHFVRDIMNYDDIKLEYISTENQLADSFTKDSSEKRLKQLCSSIFQWGFPNIDNSPSKFEVPQDAVRLQYA